MTNVIVAACSRTSAQWRNLDAETLADLIVTPVALRPMTLTAVLQAVNDGNGYAAEFAQIWNFDGYKDEVEKAFEAGDLLTVQVLLATMPFVIPDGAKAALASMLAANTLRLVDAVAVEFGTTAQATINAGDVSAAMNEARYTWHNGEWNR